MIGYFLLSFNRFMNPQTIPKALLRPHQLEQIKESNREIADKSKKIEDSLRHIFYQKYTKGLIEPSLINETLDRYGLSTRLQGYPHKKYTSLYDIDKFKDQDILGLYYDEVLGIDILIENKISGFKYRGFDITSSKVSFGTKMHNKANMVFVYASLGIFFQILRVDRDSEIIQENPEIFIDWVMTKNDLQNIIDTSKFEGWYNWHFNGVQGKPRNKRCKRRKWFNNTYQ